MKSKQEIQELKRGWKNDPCWDIEETEGFEDHREELFHYRLEKEREWNNDRLCKFQAKADELHCSFVLAEYILNLENRLDNLEARIEKSREMNDRKIRRW